MWPIIKSAVRRAPRPATALLLALVLFLSGFPSSALVSAMLKPRIVDRLYLSLQDPDVVDRGVALLTPAVERAHAATFSMQTGYYIGDNSDNRPITGVGFQPDLVLVKDNTTAGNDGVDFRTSTMSGDSTAKLGDADANGTDLIQSLDSDGFTIGASADVNSGNIQYNWEAFSGSDCSSSGTFCVGSYTGSGSAKNVTTVGFAPALVIVKRSGASYAVWTTSAMATGATDYFEGAAQLTTQAITGLLTNGFSVGTNAVVNTSGQTYWFVAFKQVAGAMTVGEYTGNATDNRNIDSSVNASLNYKPDFAFVKEATSTQIAVGTNRELYADRSFLFTDAASAANDIQGLLAGGGFQVGTGAAVNSAGLKYDYATFAGDSAKAPGSTPYEIANGSYTGTGAAQSVTGLSFTPDLVVIKNNSQTTNRYAVFKTSLMSGDRTAYLASGTTIFTGGVTSIDTNGFTVGTNANVSTSGDTYYWTAFGNAIRPDKVGGSSDFLVGEYIGTAIDSTNIDRLPFQPDLVAIKQVGTAAGTWRTSNQSGDLSLFFANTAQAANDIQSLNSDGFQVGTAANVNTSGSTYDYFAFKGDSAFSIGQYTGTGATKSVTTSSCSPTFLWTKKTTGGTARAGVMRTSAQTGNAAQPFTNAATIVGDITALLTNGFTLGTGVEANENTYTYQYAAWNTPSVAPSVTTDIATAVGASSASLNATVDDSGGVDATQHGFAYSTNSTLSSGVSTTTLGSFSGNGYYNGTINSLSNDTTYYFRAYSTNCTGTGYGAIGSFTTGDTVPTRKIRLFEGFSIKFSGGKMVLY